jgi:glycosyltransferase involved in cell wall biosynthesis
MSGGALNTAQKGHDLLVRAWQKGQIGGRGGRLHLLGDGSLRPALEKLAANDPTIRFHGTVANVRQWLRATDVFVMPSRYEGLPIAAIEAVSEGLPAIFSDIAPLRELEPPFALYIPANEESSLISAMSSVVSNVPQVDTDSVLSFRERFSIEKTAFLYERLYNQYS